MFESSNEQSGTVGLLVGVIILVFTGIFFSLLADKRFKFSSDRVSLEESLVEEAHQLQVVRGHLDVAKEQWKKEGMPLSGQEADLKKASEDARSSKAELAALRERQAAVAEELSAAEESFAAYRDRYRRHARTEAAGEQVKELRTRGGRAYADVTLRRVTSAGIEISHAQGISRLLPEDLDAAWHERFQWDREEVEKALGQEKVAEDNHRQAVDRTRPSATEPVAGKPLSPDKKANLEAEQKLAALRREVIETRNHLNRAESEVDRARSDAMTNRGRSVPGSLETWDQKVRRLEAASNKFRAKYVAARGRLATAAPDDALLRDSTTP